MKHWDLPSKNATISAINRFHFSCYGLCFWYYPNVPPQVLQKILTRLGGRNRGGWYWRAPLTGRTKDLETAREQRATMLAFLLTWASDPDFEV